MTQSTTIPITTLLRLMIPGGMMITGMALTTTTGTAPLLPHGYYEQLRTNATVVTRRGNIDLLQLEQQQPEQDDDDIGNIAMCHLVNYLGFSRASATDCSDQKQAAKIYKELAATLLAVQHFNNGDGVIVSEIEGIQHRCPIRLSAEFHDSQYTPNVVVQSLTQILANQGGGGAPTTLTASDVSPQPTTTTTTTSSSAATTCAVIGARTSSSTSPSAIVSGVYNIPQLSFTATSPELNNRFKYPYFARIVPADDAAAQAAMRFLRDEVGSTHLAVLYLNDPFGNNYNQAIQKQADRFGISIHSFPVAFPPDLDDINTQLLKVRDTGIRHVFMVFFSDHIEPVMTQAHQLGIVGTDYFWFLGISTSYFNDIQLNATDPLTTALTGMGILPEFGAKPDSNGYHRFVEVWKSLGEEDVHYFNSKMPSIRGYPNTCYQAPSNFFQESSSGSTAHFAYDTVMTIGLGACAALQQNDDDNDDNDNNRELAVGVRGLDGMQHMDAIMDVVFDGATGIVSLDKETGSRDPLKFSYAVLNVQPQPQPQQDDDMVSFVTPETIVLTPNNELTDWNVITKDIERPFRFADGTTSPPPSLPSVDVEMNYLGNLVWFGYATFVITVGLSIIFGIWTYRNRHVRVVKASQPFFLIMVCTGTMVLGSVAIPLSMDDEHFSSNAGGATDAACMSIPWLSSLGFVTAFSALASKTWRINQLHRSAMRLTRLKLTPWDVLRPFLLLTAINVIVLVGWTVMAPLQFVRTADSGTDPWNRVVSSTGRCVHDHHDSGDSIPYMIALAVINLSAVVFANTQAYRARNIHTEYSESRYIALIMLVLLQSWLTGIPVIALVYDVPRSSYVVIVLIILLTSMAVLLLVFVPKIMHTRAYQKEQRATLAKVGNATTTNGNSNKRSAGGHVCSNADNEVGIPRETWEDDAYGLRVFRGESAGRLGCRQSSQESLHSYSSVEGLKMYLRQSTRTGLKMLENQDATAAESAASNSHLEDKRLCDSLGHSATSATTTTMIGGSFRNSITSRGCEPAMEVLSEESTRDLESSRTL